MIISIIDNKVFKISDNYIFLINIGYINKKDEIIYVDSNKIYILSKKEDQIIKQNPKFFLNLSKQRVSSRNENKIFKLYSQYVINGKKINFKKNNDCLLFAEKTAINDYDYIGKSSIFKVLNDKSTRRFGVSDKQNISIAKYAKSESNKNKLLFNIYINPEINDAYAIVPNNIYGSEGMCPYHVATVIFKDGDTNITLEADAGKKMDYPVFDMYSTTQDNMSFFSIHFKTYIQAYRDKDNKVKFALPTMLYLKKDFIDKKKIKKHSVKKTSLKKSDNRPKNYYTRKSKNYNKLQKNNKIFFK